MFRSKNLTLELSATIDSGEGDHGCPKLVFEKSTRDMHLGEGLESQFHLKEGQVVSFILRDCSDPDPGLITTAVVDDVQKTTHKFWSRWISQSKYHGRWEDVVTRSLFILKLLTYEPTGAIVAAPTFSLPEDFGGM